MTARRSTRYALMGAAFATALAACGGDKFDRSQTVVSGLIVLPSSNNCADCSNQGVTVQVLGLVKGAPPQTIATLRTSTLGVYMTEDLTPALAASSASPDTNGDGERSFIIVASVNGSGAEIGGVLSATTGADASKDFNPTTHIACLAAVFVTQGMDDASAGCTVQAACAPSDTTCLTTIDPDVLTRERIDNLEEAASPIATQVLFPAEVPRAACAVLTCTDSGSRAADANCVQTVFAAGR
jgi:hypothetical protein